MRVAVIQHDIVWEDATATCAHLVPQLAQAAGAGAQLAVLTEMFAIGFSDRAYQLAEDLDGPTATWMSEQARTHRMWVAGSLPLTSPSTAVAGQRAKPTNTLLVVGPDGDVHRYDKVHPFTYAGEHDRFASGAEQDVVIDIEGLRIGLSICYDLRFSYLYWDRAERVDAELIVANWPESRRHHWQALIDARAVENQVYVVASNRVGMGGTLAYAGDSRVVGPDGEVRAAAARAEAILVTDLDAQVVADVRATFPVAADRRS